MSKAALVTLDFEEAVAQIDIQIGLMEAKSDAEIFADELRTLRQARESLLAKTYANLTPWQTVRVARHPQRPQTLDYVRMICRDWSELHGDRRFGDDAALITGFARIGSLKCLLVGHHKGRSTEERIKCRFGCANPEGYRKALLKMKLAEKFHVPIVTLIDTPGAYPGLDSEQRGHSEAIAVNLREMSRLRTPIVCIVIGEGGSGGALGIGVGDRIAMLQHSWYSVISPEGCAAILWKKANEQTNNSAAQALALTAECNLKNGLIDAIIPEPNGGAHRDPQATAERLQGWVVDSIRELQRLSPDTLVRLRFDKIRNIGSHKSNPAT